MSKFKVGDKVTINPQDGQAAGALRDCTKGTRYSVTATAKGVGRRRDKPLVRFIDDEGDEVVVEYTDVTLVEG